MSPRLCLSLAAACAACLLSAPAAPAAEGPGVSIEAKKGVLEFKVGKDLVTRYHVGESVAKPYFWPLTAANGAVVTRAWPMEQPAPPGGSTDHVHQKSAWFCHGDVIPEGVALKHKVKGVEGVDFWSEAAGHGVIACVHVGEPKNDKDHATVETKNEWRTADGVKVLDETRTISLYALGDGRLYVLDIDLHATAAPITFGDTKEGSIGVRVNDEIRETPGKNETVGGHGKLTNAEGKTGEKAVWGYPSKWCDYSGTIGGKEAGIAIFDDPGNKYPAAWHSRGYGLMAANPFGRGKSGFPALKGRTDLVKIPKGEHLKLRYGIFVHDGNVKDGKVAEAFEKFVKIKG
ncbi:MAG TPA: PmoA family protein [Gemmataceae bacterium]|nr:PmoA family protein [Gemmataceae bacterium]